ncbi:hypothetical protein RE628_19945 [Paenibacillus sp. D2_2]|uniref:alpha/beta hydrolase family protein n=1 Tax=Paenibacillus sp. D2_2 TaxID=3073092 RepID=UPI00281625B5|nr:dienelactone hydrolase family protein [Paenibacillus sp. D2_2]WMT39657.1 hypothetical protein RE628_19945 [Paenibacillus sp. D2_2]
MGRITHVLHDNSRNDLFSINDKRSIIVSIFYPTEVENTELNETSYLELFDPCQEKATTILEEMNFDIHFIRETKTKVHNNAKPNLHLNSYPIILYVPAFGVVRDMYIYHIQQLVDNGFIVVSIGSTYESMFSIFPEGLFVRQSEDISKINSTDFQFWRELLDTRVEDIYYVLNHLEEIQSQLTHEPIIFSSIGIVGHSLGGAAAIEVAARDSRIEAGVLLDPSFHLMEFEENIKLNTPFLIMRQEKCTYEELRNELSEGIITPYINGYQRLFTLFSKYNSFIKVREAHHMTFSDIPMLFNEEQISNKHKIISIYATCFLCEFMKAETLSYQRLLGNKKNVEIVEVDIEGKPIGEI